VRQAMAFALARLDEPLGVEQLARHVAVSVRTFARRFKAESGVTPGEWLLEQRLVRARRLLETTDLSVDRIAFEAGFGSVAALRYHFSYRVGTTPAAYRRTFRGSVVAGM
jgi:AraC family transcriptional regulator, transcriptional activator FtrA